MGQLVFQATLGGQVNLVGPNTASTYNINVPTVNGNMVTTGDTGTVTNTMLAGSIANNKLTNSSVTIGSTNIALGATSTTLAGLTGVTSSAITDSGLTSGRVTYATTGGLLTDSANLLYSGTDLTVYGITVGRGAGAVSTNTAVGASALAAGTASNNNTTAIGYNALLVATAGSNLAVGSNALVANTTGDDNTAIGSYAPLAANTTGTKNIAVGRQALNSNTTASYNTAVGYQAGYTNATGLYNTFIGTQAGYTSNVSGNAGNTCVGYGAGYGLTTGIKNTFIGGNASYSSGFYVTTGSSNTILGGYNGNQGGLDIRTASNYIVLSDGDGNPRGVFNGSGDLLVGTATTSLENSRSFSWVGASGGVFRVNHSTANGSGDSYMDFGYNATKIGSITQNGTTGVLYNLTSDYRLKNNPVALTGAKDFVMALQPKTWDWWDGSGKGVGFIAHEFMEVAKYSGNGVKDAVDENGKPVYQSIQPSSSEVMANLVALIQEQQQTIDQLKAELAELKGA
jgi:hypothetical protein